MSVEKVFGSYAEYYDLFYQDKNYDAEAKKVVSILHGCGERGTNILDMGCGTGRHAMAMADQGYTIDGLDLSESMLHFAQERLRVSGSKAVPCTFSHGDIRTYRNGKRYDAVTSLFHVMCYQTTDDDLRLAFKTAADHLNSGGIFLFDFWYGPGVLTDPPTVRVKNIENEHLQVTRISVPDIDAQKNIVNVQYQVFSKKTEDTLWAQHTECHAMRYIFPQDIQHLAHDAGFEVLTIQDWDTLQQPDSTSWNAFCLLRKVI